MAGQFNQVQGSLKSWRSRPTRLPISQQLIAPNRDNVPQTLLGLRQNSGDTSVKSHTPTTSPQRWASRDAAVVPPVTAANFQMRMGRCAVCESQKHRPPATRSIHTLAPGDSLI